MMNCNISEIKTKDTIMQMMNEKLHDLWPVPSYPE